MFEIEKGIPIPNMGTKKDKYPWRNMKIGDSFFVANKTVKIMGPCAHHIAKNRDMKFSVRTVEENGKKGVRIWRIE